MPKGNEALAPSEDSLRARLLLDFPMHPHLDFDFTINDKSYPMGVLSSYPKELLDILRSVTLDYLMGNKVSSKSLKYIYAVDSQYPSGGIGEDVNELILQSSHIYCDSFSKIGDLYCDGAGHIIAGVSLLRLFSALSGPLHMANRGFFSETVAVARSYLEQISWCVKIRWMATDSDPLLKVSAEKTIPALKQIYPRSGEFYGYLSKIVHHHVETHDFFNPPDGNGGRAGSISASTFYRLRSLCVMLVLLDILCVSTETLYYDELEKRNYLDSNAFIKKSRPPLLLFDRINSRYGTIPFVQRVGKFLA